MRSTPLVLAATVAGTLLLGTGTGIAAPAGTSAPAGPSAEAVGTATSAVSLLQLTAAGHQVHLGDLTLTSSTVGGHRTAVVAVTPLLADGTAVGQQTVTPANSPITVPVLTTTALPAAISNVITAQSPTLRVSAAVPSTGPTSSITADSLGGLSVLGLPLSLDGSVHNGTEVTSAGAASVKQLAVNHLALPTLGDVLAGLGLDVRTLPTGVLTGLLAKLNLTTLPMTTATQAVTAAQGRLAGATTGLSAATTGFTTATGTLTRLLGAVSIPTYAGLPSPGRALVEATSPGTAAAYTDYLAKGDAVGLAQAALTQAQQALSAATGLVLGAAQTVLNNTPLVTVGSLTASTSAVVTNALPGGQRALIDGGRITGLKVLGTDVLLTALGSSSADLSSLTGPTLAKVNAVAAGLSGTLGAVLSAVPGLTLTAPRVDLLTQQTGTGVTGGFGRADTALHVLTITLPVITLPAALALPGAGALPAFAGTNAVNGVLTSNPGSIGLLTLSERSSFRPAVAAVAPTLTPKLTPTPTPKVQPVAAARPTLPYTGPAKGVAAFAVLLMAGAGLLRRRAGRPVTEA